MNRVYLPNMIMVENGEFWGGDDNILGLLDFPMESLEDDGYVGDWNSSESQIPGPIPSSVLMGPPGGKIDTGPMYSFPGPVALINGSPEQNPNEIPDVQESTVFQTPSPNSVLESSGSCSSGITIKSSNPTRPRSKRARPMGPAVWAQLSPPVFLAAPSSKRTTNIKKNKEKRKNPIESSSSHRPVVTKKCTHCEITKTPQWREGPLGPKTLCNACGVRYRSGRLYPEYRPAASPTFVPYLHSNSHRKVIEMRSKGKRAVTEFDVGPPVSPQPEFVPTSSLMFDFMYN